MNHCLFNGKILPFEEAKININELGLLRSYAVFDYFRTYNGKLICLHDYLMRFRNSASALHLPLKYSDIEIKNFVHALLSLHSERNLGIRLLLTGGYSEDSMSFKEPNFFILIEDIPSYSKEIFENGVKLISCEFQRWLPRIKTTGYVNAIRLHQEKEKQNAFEILYHQRGTVSETARNNFFIVKNGQVITSGENILLGITRKVILKLSSENSITVTERGITLPELAEAEEAFISGSLKGIVPVVQVDNFKIGNGKVGNVTQKLIRLFQEYCNSFEKTKPL